MIHPGRSPIFNHWCDSKTEGAPLVHLYTVNSIFMTPERSPAFSQTLSQSSGEHLTHFTAKSRAVFFTVCTSRSLYIFIYLRKANKSSTTAPLLLLNLP